MSAVTITSGRKLVKGDKVYVTVRGRFFGIPGVVQRVRKYDAVVRMAYPPKDTYQGDLAKAWDPLYDWSLDCLITEKEWNDLRLKAVKDTTVTLATTTTDDDRVWGGLEVETALIDGTPSTVIRQTTGDTLHALIVNDPLVLDQLISALTEARAMVADPGKYLPANIEPDLN